MAPVFEVLGTAGTPAGVVRLQRRWDPSREVDVYEVKLGDEYLMSSLFTAAEEELARLGLAAVDRGALTVVVGGLGLGWTARTALEDDRVAELVVVEAVDGVIEWHRRGLLPGAAALVDDDRVRLVHADVFACNAGDGFDPDAPGRRFDVVLLDVDHSPRHHLDPSHASFYTTDGLARMAGHLTPGGAFALWSDDPPDEQFLRLLDDAFVTVEAHTVTFAGVDRSIDAANTVYVATTPT